MSQDTLIEQFRRLWRESFPGTSCEIPTNQQILASLIVFTLHSEGPGLFLEMQKLVLASLGTPKPRRRK